MSPAQFLASLPNLSPLAAALSQLYTSLKSSLLATISLGPNLVQVLLRGELTLDVPPSSAQREDADERASSQSGANVRPAPLFSRMRRRPAVRFQEWETLLPLEDPEDLKWDVDEGSLLWRFLDICTPTLSFAEYETLLDIETEDDQSPLQEIVEHLVHWRKARVVDVVSLKGIYVLRPAFDPKTYVSTSYTSTTLTL
jgi:hypothetical protein